MPIIGTTTLTDLERNIATMLMARTPTLERHRSDGWAWSEDNDQVAPSRATRLFVIRWGNVRSRDEDGVFGASDAETYADLSIITDYRAVPERELGQVVGHDHVDVEHWLRDRLHASSVDAIFGLMWAQSDGIVTLDEDAQRISHDFLITFQRAI